MGLLYPIQTGPSAGLIGCTAGVSHQELHLRPYALHPVGNGRLFFTVADYRSRDGLLA